MLSVLKGPNTCGDQVDGDQSWANPSNIKVADNVSASIALYDLTNASALRSDSLQFWNFGFAIPSNATITGVQMAIKRVAANRLADFTIQLGTAPGVYQSANRSGGALWATTQGVVYFGGQTDLWGMVLTPAIVNSPNFGGRLNCVFRGVFQTVSRGYVDAVSLTIFYNVPPPISVSVTPSAANLTLGQTQQFGAVVNNSGNQTVTWSVVGGAAFGTINGAGLYTTPGVLPSPPKATIQAVSQADPSKVGGASVSLGLGVNRVAVREIFT